MAATSCDHCEQRQAHLEVSASGQSQVALPVCTVKTIIQTTWHAVARRVFAGSSLPRITKMCFRLSGKVQWAIQQNAELLGTVVLKAKMNFL